MNDDLATRVGYRRVLRARAGRGWASRGGGWTARAATFVDRYISQGEDVETFGDNPDPAYMLMLIDARDELRAAAAALLAIVNRRLRRVQARLDGLAAAVAKRQHTVDPPPPRLDDVHALIAAPRPGPVAGAAPAAA